MEAARIKRLTLLVSVVAATAAYGTGGDWFDYPARLSDTIEMLPGKSLGEIFLETSNISEATTPLDLDSAGREIANNLSQQPLSALQKRTDDLIAQARAHN